MRAVLALFLLVAPAFASPESSNRPVPRLVADVSVAEIDEAGPLAPEVSAKPKKRPRLQARRAQRRIERQTRLVQRNSDRFAKGAQGSVCQDSTIKGSVIAPIPGRISGCGVTNPVRITSVDGVALTQAPTIDCNTARALKAWVTNGVKPIVGKRGGGVASLKVVAHYACRTRNNQPGARISEHGKGRAIDIAAINLRDGEVLSVLTGWRNKSQGPLLQKMHKAACGPFGTVLGPRSDRFHQDHFHFDTARYRSGSYCR